MRARRVWLAVAGLAAVVVAAASLGPATARRASPGPLAPQAAGVTAAVPLEPAACQPGSGGGAQPLVAAFFYYWYDLPRGVHSANLTQHPINPAASYRSIPWLQAELADMRAAGIDMALAAYWGEAEPSSDIGLVNLALAATALAAMGVPPPGIGMFFDTGLMASWPAAYRDLRVPENQERVYGLIQRFYTLVPRDRWALYQGRPMVWFWSANFGIQGNAAFTAYLRARFLADFGVAPYLVGEGSWLTPAAGVVPFDDYYGWGSAVAGFGEPIANIASVGPGYDERLLAGPGRSGRFTDRENGRFYQRNWEFVLEARKPLVVIETWNEFHEASGIAHTQEQGRRYIDLTRWYVSRLKCG